MKMIMLAIVSRADEARVATAVRPDYDALAAAMCDKRARIPADRRDLLGDLLGEFPLERFAAVVFPHLPARVRRRAALALLASEVNGDLYLDHDGAWLGGETASEGAATAATAGAASTGDGTGDHARLARIAWLAWIETGWILDLTRLAVHVYASEDPARADGECLAIAAWGTRWYAASLAASSPDVASLDGGGDARGHGSEWGR